MAQSAQAKVAGIDQDDAGNNQTSPSPSHARSANAASRAPLIDPAVLKPISDRARAPDDLSLAWPAISISSGRAIPAKCGTSTGNEPENPQSVRDPATVAFQVGQPIRERIE